MLEPSTRLRGCLASEDLLYCTGDIRFCRLPLWTWTTTAGPFEPSRYCWLCSLVLARSWIVFVT